MKNWNTCYIATGLENFELHNQVRDRLKPYNIKLTYDWTTHGSLKHTSVERLKEGARAEIDGVLEADFVIVLLPGGRGTHTELGMAIAAQKDIFMYDPGHQREGWEVGTNTCIFYFDEAVDAFNDLDELIEEVIDAFGVRGIEPSTEIDLMDYVIGPFREGLSFCPDCADADLMILRPRDESSTAPSYFTHHCGYLGRVGDRRLR